MNEETMNAAQGEVTVDELEENLTESPQQEENAQDEQEAMIAEIRAGLGELFEDGWSPQEMGAFTQDEAVRSDIAQGKSVARAACAYLRRTAAYRRGVPTARTTAAGSVAPDNRIEHMTDAQFDAFSRRAREAMLAGKRVRVD